MKLLHTSDWHLGRLFHNISLLDQQKKFLDEIYDIANREQVDGIIIAGDIFDRPVPPAGAIKLFSEFLTKVVEAIQTRVFIIPGNHDSSTRLEFASDLLKGSNVYIAKTDASCLEPVEITKDGKKFGFYLFPYLDPIKAQAIFDHNFTNQNSIYEYLTNNLSSLDKLDHKIAVAHLFMVGGVESESEKKLIGGIEGVSHENFANFDYTALGHLHGYQCVKGNIFYSGTPFKYSFSEVRHRKGVNLVTIGQEVTVEKIELSIDVDLKQVEGHFEEIMQSDEWTQRDLQNHFYKFILLDEKPIYQVMKRLRTKYVNTLEVERKSKRILSSFARSADGIALSKDSLAKDEVVLNMIEDFFKKTQDYQLEDFDRKFIERHLENLNAP